MPEPHIVSRGEWLTARKAFLAEEKAFTRARDALSAKRRELPWVKIDTPYTDAEIAEAPKAVQGKTEIEALIAYLQVLGTAVK